METSETIRHSGGIRGIRVNEVGWGTRGALGQVIDRGGDFMTGWGDGDPAQTLKPVKATSDLLEDVERSGVVSGVELVG